MGTGMGTGWAPPSTDGTMHREQIHTEAFLHLRYEGTDCSLMCSAKGHPPTASSCRAGDFYAAFTSRFVLALPAPVPVL